MLQETIEDVEVTVSRSVELFKLFKQLPESQKLIGVAVLFSVGTIGFCVSLMILDANFVLICGFLVELLRCGGFLLPDADILKHLDTGFLCSPLHQERGLTKVHASKAAETVH